MSRNALVADVRALRDQMAAWRREIHAHPELAFEEHRTAAFIADQLREMGLDVHGGIGGTGVVASLRAGSSSRSIGIRAEMDALPIKEETQRPYASRNEGVMHACGHDGHCAMVLGAARFLTRRPDQIHGTVRFIFQPAEENEAGGRAMVEDGLFERFPVDGVYALHNEPGMPVGTFGVRPGPVTAALDLFEITVEGRPCHAARPQAGADAIVCSAAIVTALQTIRTRDLDPLDAAVLSVTRIEGGNSWNVLPKTVTLRGTARSFREDVQDTIETRTRGIVESLATAHGCAGRVDYRRVYPPVVNSGAQSAAAAEAARRVAGANRVRLDDPPITAAEDFAFMLQARPGCYAFLGNGDSAPVHTPEYDFNDDALVWGASYWADLARSLLAPGG